MSCAGLQEGRDAEAVSNHYGAESEVHRRHRPHELIARGGLNRWSIPCRHLRYPKLKKVVEMGK